MISIEQDLPCWLRLTFPQAQGISTHRSAGRRRSLLRLPSCLPCWATVLGSLVVWRGANTVRSEDRAAGSPTAENRDSSLVTCSAPPQPQLLFLTASKWLFCSKHQSNWCNTNNQCTAPQRKSRNVVLGYRPRPPQHTPCRCSRASKGAPYVI